MSGPQPGEPGPDDRHVDVAVPLERRPRHKVDLLREALTLHTRDLAVAVDTGSWAGDVISLILCATTR